MKFHLPSFVSIAALTILAIAPARGQKATPTPTPTPCGPGQGNRGQVRFLFQTIQFDETFSAIAVTAIREYGDECQVSVDVQVTGGSATSGLDYGSPLAGTLSWSDGEGDPDAYGSGVLVDSAEVFRYFIVPIVDDHIDDDNETVVFELTNPVGVSIGSISTCTATIIDDETHPTISISANTSAPENTLKKHVITVTASGGFDENAVVPFSVSSTANTQGFFQSANWISNWNVESNANKWLLVQGGSGNTIDISTSYAWFDNQSIKMHASSYWAYLIPSYDLSLDKGWAPFETSKKYRVSYFARSSVPVSILPEIRDGNSSNVVKLLGIETFTDEWRRYTHYFTPESAGNYPHMRWRVDDSVAVPIPLDIFIDGFTLVQTTQAVEEDFMVDAPSTPLVFTNPDSKQIPIYFFDDYLYEGDGEENPNDRQQVTVTLGNTIANEPVNHARGAIGSQPSASVTIEDNDPVPTLGIARTGSATNPIESVGSVGIQAILSARAGKTIVPSLAKSGTATELSDYTVSLPALAPGQTVSSGNVNIFDDPTDEYDETVVMTLQGNAYDDYLIAPPPNEDISFTILDDDNPPTVQFNSASYNGFEDSRKVICTVQLLATSQKLITVKYRTLPGSAETEDYTLTEGTMTFYPGGSLTSTLEVPLLIDCQSEPLETFSVELFDPSNVTLGSNSTATVDIVDGIACAMIEIAGAANVEFGNEEVIAAPSFPQSVSVYNRGNADLHFASDGIFLDGGDIDSFSLYYYPLNDKMVYSADEIAYPTYQPYGPSTAPLGVQEMRSIVVVFNPKSTGAKSSHLKINSSAFNAPTLDLTLVGQGIAPPPIDPSYAIESELSNQTDRQEWQFQRFSPAAGRYSPVGFEDSVSLGIRQRIDFTIPDLATVLNFALWKAPTSSLLPDASDEIVMSKWTLNGTTIEGDITTTPDIRARFNSGNFSSGSLVELVSNSASPTYSPGGSPRDVTVFGYRPPDAKDSTAYQLFFDQVSGDSTTGNLPDTTSNLEKMRVQRIPRQALIDRLDPSSNEWNLSDPAVQMQWTDFALSDSQGMLPGVSLQSVDGEGLEVTFLKSQIDSTMPFRFCAWQSPWLIHDNPAGFHFEGKVGYESRVRLSSSHSSDAVRLPTFRLRLSTASFNYSVEGVLEDVNIPDSNLDFGTSPKDYYFYFTIPEDVSQEDIRLYLDFLYGNYALSDYPSDDPNDPNDDLTITVHNVEIKRTTTPSQTVQLMSPFAGQKIARPPVFEIGLKNNSVTSPSYYDRLVDEYVLEISSSSDFSTIIDSRLFTGAQIRALAKGDTSIKVPAWLSVTDKDGDQVADSVSVRPSVNFPATVDYYWRVRTVDIFGRENNTATGTMSATSDPYFYYATAGSSLTIPPTPYSSINRINLLTGVRDFINLPSAKPVISMAVRPDGYLYIIQHKASSDQTCGSYPYHYNSKYLLSYLPPAGSATIPVGDINFSAHCFSGGPLLIPFYTQQLSSLSFRADGTPILYIQNPQYPEGTQGPPFKGLFAGLSLVDASLGAAPETGITKLPWNYSDSDWFGSGNHPDKFKLLTSDLVDILPANLVWVSNTEAFGLSDGEGYWYDATCTSTSCTTISGLSFPQLASGLTSINGVIYGATTTSGGFTLYKLDPYAIAEPILDSFFLASSSTSDMVAVDLGRGDFDIANLPALQEHELFVSTGGTPTLVQAYGTKPMLTLAESDVIRFYVKIDPVHDLTLVKQDSSIRFDAVENPTSDLPSYQWMATVPEAIPSGFYDVFISSTGSDRYYGTVDVVAFDSDGDGMADSWEMLHFGNLDHGASEDLDGDGLTNLEEFSLASSDPNSSDSDADGVPDLLEYVQGLANPDRLDGSNPRMNPNNSDSDSDGVPDGTEYYFGFNPIAKDASSVPSQYTGLAASAMDGDYTEDQLYDVVSRRIGISPLSADTDSDGLTNAEENVLGTSPYLSDSDDDATSDNLDAFPLDPTLHEIPSDIAGSPEITLTDPNTHQ